MPLPDDPTNRPRLPHPMAFGHPTLIVRRRSSTGTADRNLWRAEKSVPGTRQAGPSVPGTGADPDGVIGTRHQYSASVIGASLFGLGFDSENDFLENQRTCLLPHPRRPTNTRPIPLGFGMG